MNCCGMKRPLPAARAEEKPPGGSLPTQQPPTPPRATGVPFQYTGATRLQALGPISRRRYRFDAPGAVAVVDARDAAAFAAIAVLRRLA